MADKIISPEKAVKLIKDEDFVAIQGSGGGVGEPTLIRNRLGARFRKEGSPRSLTLCHATGLGDKNEIGTDCLALKGLVKRDIAGHLGMAPKMAKMILDREIFNGAIVNLGVGISSGIAAVAIEEGRVDDFTLTIEQGSIGGIPAGGVIFGVSYNPTAIIEEDAQFSFYDGGGLEVALACDFIFCSNNAFLGQPEVNLGFVTGWGGSFRLPRRIGIAKAKDLIFTGRTLDAEQAYNMDLIDFAGNEEELDLFINETASV